MLRYIEMRNLPVKTFPDGETEILVPLFDPSDHVVLIGSCHTAQASETFLAAAYEIGLRGPASFTILNTYFRHARSERKSAPSQVVMAKFQARLWSGVGGVYPGVDLVFLDLHTDLILSFFEGPVHAKDRTCFKVLEDMAFRTWSGLKSVVYATVDAGGVHKARALAETAKCGFAHIDKRRLSGSETEVREVHGDVDGCDVLIFDDMISTGGSLMKAASAYKARGARRVFGVATHGVFAEGAVSRLAASDVDGVLVTNSHPNAQLRQKEAPEGFLFVHEIHPELLV